MILRILSIRYLFRFLCFVCLDSLTQEVKLHESCGSLHTQCVSNIENYTPLNMMQCI